MSDHATRPAVREVVGVAVAQEELLAVRQMLADLQREVEAEEAAADRAERAAADSATWQEAIDRSRRVVEEMTALREATWRAEYEQAESEARHRLAEAERRVTELAQASHAQAAALLDATASAPTASAPSASRFPAPEPLPAPPATRFPVPEAPPVPVNPVAAPVPPIPPAPSSIASSAPPAGPPLAVAPAPSPVSVATPAPAAPAAEVDAAHEAFWREEAAASAARAARTGWTPTELVLPTVALVMILAAVLLLVG